MLLVRETSQQLFAHYHNTLPNHPSQQSFEIANERVLVQTLPFHDPRGLDWTIVVVVPERDFMKPIFAMSHNAIRISLIAIGVVVLAGVVTARYIATPINALAKASRSLAHSFDRCESHDTPSIPPQNIHELHLLATAFAQMAVRLKTSFQQLETINHDLENRVQIRTRELQQANDELQRLASIDGLTQIANRRCFDAYLAECWQDARDRQTDLTIVLCDIDHFKEFNDTYGHQAGDDCLRQVALTLKRAVMNTASGELADGGTALTARYGGEEFIVVLPETGTDQAQQVIEAIQAEIKFLGIPHERSSVTHHVSLSLGAAVITPNLITTPARAIVAADRALYAAKTAGRNGYCFASIDHLEIEPIESL
ncbi:MAG: diguanylate cyclase [Coleofasciculaceae cyanobacterium RL_1_1]|nr:diguanylate cyclase [Coleofasciculaceae cyanobacterium RL_1_1]